MIIDEKGKLFGKLNLLDLFLILVLVAVIAVACMLFSGDTSSSDTVPVVYTLEIQNEDATYFDHVVIGENVKSGVTGTPMGTIVGFHKEPAKVITQTDDELVLAKPEGRYDGYLEIEADAAAAYPDLSLDGDPLKIGTSLALRSESLAMHGYVVGLAYDSELFGGAQ